MHCPIAFLSFHFPRSFKHSQFFSCFYFAASFRRSSVCRPSSPFLNLKLNSFLAGPPMVSLLPTPISLSPLPRRPSVFPLWFKPFICSWFPIFSRNWSPSYVSSMKSSRLNCGVVEPFLARIFLLWGFRVDRPLAFFPFASPLDLVRSGVFAKPGCPRKWRSIVDSSHP